MNLNKFCAKVFSRSLLLIFIACSTPKDVELDPKIIALANSVFLKSENTFLAKNEKVYDLFYLDGIFYVLSNFNHLYEVGKGEKVKKNSVGELVLDGKGMPERFPGGQVMNIFEFGEKLMLFNTVPFEMHIYKDEFLAPSIFPVAYSADSRKSIDKYKVLDVVDNHALVSQEQYGKNSVFFHLIDLDNNENRFLFLEEMADKTFHFMGRFIDGNGFYFLDSLGNSLVFYDFSGEILKKIHLPIDINDIKNGEEDNIDVRIRDMFYMGSKSFLLIKREIKKTSDVKWFLFDSEFLEMKELEDVFFAKFDKGNILTYEHTNEGEAFKIQPLTNL